MKHIHVLILPAVTLAIITACAAAGIEPPAPVTTVLFASAVRSAPPAHPPSPVAPQTADIERHYRELQHKELPKIVALNATADFVARLLQADVEVRRAVDILERQGQHPGDGEVVAAGSALQKLEVMVNQPLPAVVSE